MTDMLFEHDWIDMKVDRLRMAFSDDIGSVGEASWLKVWKLCVLVWKTWGKVISSRPKVLYYLPASPNLTPVVRDIVYLGIVRWFFPKLVFHFHAGGLDEFYRKRKWLGRLTKFVYNGADCAIDVNITDPPSGEYFQAKKTKIVMNGLSVGQATRLRPDNGELHLLYVGLLCEEKGILELVDVANRLKQDGVVCEFVMVGGWESSDVQSRFEQKATATSVSEMFHFKGALSGSAKWQAYADADIFLFPTHHPTETFGLVMIEAMAYGLPIVTNRWRGVPHVIGKSGCAKLCEVGEPEQYALAIQEIVNDDALRQKMSAAATQRYQSQFTSEHFLSSMEKVFVEVLES
ncbi:MAG: glycosyltransferase family 4 protein [Akkermansiaceae bacterium]